MVRDLNASRVRPSASDEADRPSVAPAVDPFHAGNRPCLEKADQARPVERGLVPEQETKPDILAGARRPAAQVGRREIVTSPEERVEPAQAREPARQRHVDHAHPCVGEQALGEQQALRLRELDWRHPELFPERAPQMTIAHPEAGRQTLDSPALDEEPILDHARGPRRQRTHGVDAGVAGRQLRAAAQARPEALGFRQRGRREEPAAIATRHAGRTHGPAVDARRRHADEETAVEAGIARAQGLVAAVVVEHHEGHYAIVRRGVLAVFGH